MSPAVRKVGFVCLPDRQLDLFSEITRRGEYRPEVVVDANHQSCAFKMAEILEIPASGDLALFRRFPCELIVVPDDRPDLKIDLTQVLGPSMARIVTCSEMGAELGMKPEEMAAENDDEPRNWTLHLDSTEAEFGFGGTEGTPLTIERHPLEAAGTPAARTNGQPRTNGALREISETLALADDKQRLLQRILEIAVTTAGGESGSIMLVDETGEHLRIVVSDGLSEGVVLATRQKIGEGVAGQVLREGRARILVDKLDDPRYRTGRERSEIKAAVSAPIKVGERTIGVLNVSSDTRPNAFSEETLGQMERFGGEVADVLLRAIQPVGGGERSAAATVETAIDSIMKLDQPLEGRLSAVLDRLASLSHASAGRISLLDGTGHRLEVVAEFGPVAPGDRSAPSMADRGLPARALNRTEPTILTGNFGSDGERALVYLPLPASQSLGVIELEDIEIAEPHWSQTRPLLEAAVRRVATLLEYEQSRNLLARRSRQMLLLSDLTTRFLAAENAEELSDLAVAAAAEILEADLATFRRRQGDSMTLSNPEFAMGDPAGQRLMAFDAEFSDPALLSAKRETLDSCPAMLEERMVSEAGVRWAAAVPVPGITPGGVLSVYRCRSLAGRADGEDISLLVRLAECIGQTMARVEAVDAGSNGTERFMRWSVFQERIGEEMKRANRYGRTFALVTMELDGFRASCDERGLEWREAARFAVADFILREIRETDIPCWVREGRIVLLSPETTDMDDSFARRLADAWRRLVPMLKIDGLKGFEATFSESLYPHDQRDWEATIDWVADRFGDAGGRRAG